jgi:hypothetical protein
LRRFRLGFTQPRALGRKVSDEFAVPICRGHHRAVHRSRDERAWWRQAGIDPIKVARRLWKETHGMGPEQGLEDQHYLGRTRLPHPRSHLQRPSKSALPQSRKKAPPYWVFPASRARAVRSSRLLIAAFSASSPAFSPAS